MTLNKEAPVFGSRQLKKLNIGDLVYWIEWFVESSAHSVENPEDPLHTRKNKRFGVISELYVEDREHRKVAMAKVVPMNTSNTKHIYEKSMLATSLKLVSKGGMISGKKDNRIISE